MSNQQQIIIQDFCRRQEKLSSGMKCGIDDELDISVDTAVLAHHWRRMVMTDNDQIIGTASDRSVSQPYLVGWWDRAAALPGVLSPVEYCFMSSQIP